MYLSEFIGMVSKSLRDEKRGATSIVNYPGQRVCQLLL